MIIEPSVNKIIIDKNRLFVGILVVDLLVESKLCKSKSEAKRLMKQKGIYFQQFGGEKCTVESPEVKIRFINSKEVVGSWFTLWRGKTTCRNIGVE